MANAYYDHETDTWVRLERTPDGRWRHIYGYESREAALRNVTVVDAELVEAE